jgi:hypothetical protein
VAGSRFRHFGNRARFARGFHHRRFFRHGFAFGGPFFAGAYAYDDYCWRRRSVLTPWGWRSRWVNVCY